jgi:hypothetical protein
MSTTKIKTPGPPVSFTRQQYEYLNREFPELTNLVEANELAYRAGQRQVLAVVRARLRHD